MKTVIQVIVHLLLSTLIFGQVTVDLNQVLQLTLKQSASVQIAQSNYDITRLENDFFNSSLKPTLELGASLPNYISSSTPVTQPDGSLAFQNVQQSNSFISLNANYQIVNTNTTIFASSDLQRFNDFQSNLVSYNGAPLRVGIIQPIFGFNSLKYQRKIQTLELEEASRQLNFTIEKSLFEAVQLYFDILITFQDLEIAKTNKTINKNLLNITEERLALGKVSRDEKIQLEIEYGSTLLAVSQAQSNYQQSINNLDVFLGSTLGIENTSFQVPYELTIEKSDSEFLFQKSQINRLGLISFKRAQAVLERDFSKARFDFGVQAEVQAFAGLNKSGNRFKDVYQQPFDEQMINMRLRVPIVAWGQRKAILKRIKAEQENGQLNFDQNNLILKNDIQSTLIEIRQIYDNLDLIESLTKSAIERFEIASDRYVLGDLDITNLTLAQREKDQAKRNYLIALRNLWLGYYRIRVLTGFDISTNQNIYYQQRNN